MWLHDLYPLVYPFAYLASLALFIFATAIILFFISLKGISALINLLLMNFMWLDVLFSSLLIVALVFDIYNLGIIALALTNISCLLILRRRCTVTYVLVKLISYLIILFDRFLKLSGRVFWLMKSLNFILRVFTISSFLLLFLRFGFLRLY